MFLHACVMNYGQDRYATSSEMFRTDTAGTKRSTISSTSATQLHASESWKLPEGSYTSVRTGIQPCWKALDGAGREAVAAPVAAAVAAAVAAVGHSHLRMEQLSGVAPTWKFEYAKWKAGRNILYSSGISDGSESASKEEEEEKKKKKKAMALGD
ncbi:hypothetical protein Landi51_12369 [Colletotrichum acutatum]